MTELGFEPIRPPYVVLNDAPVGEGGTEDLLGTAETARNLAELILASRAAAPFTLAVDARWGMGKSSLMRTLSSTLENNEPDAVSTVWFNAWTSARADAVEGLIKSVLFSFDRNVVRRTVRGLLRRTQVVGALRAATLVASSFFGFAHAVDEIWRALALDAKSRNEIKAVVRDMAQDWLARGGKGTNRRLLVVFIDDLDRCADDRVFAVCEAIKLYLDVPGIVFVLGCDQVVLGQAVGGTAGAQYLEKIIQVNYPIPAPGEEEAQRLVNGYVEHSGTAHLFDDSMKRLLVERTGRNPRRIKRLINSFVLEHRLNRSWDDLGAKNLVKVVLLQHFYPTFYRNMLSGTDRDPVREFVDYLVFRGFVRQHSEGDPLRWRRLFDAVKLAPPSEDADGAELEASLAELEKQLPVEFPELAGDREFVSLVESLFVDSVEWQRLIQQPLVSQASSFAGPRDLRRLRVLWIDDYPDGNRWPIDQLEAGGAKVESVTDRAGALAALSRLRPNVLISDVRRGDDDKAGFTDLAYLRDNGLYGGPAFFYCGQVTPARVRAAKQLDAEITNDPGELLSLIDESA
ncbi:response regulator [Amycolatopsis acidicola]|uniref:Response regulator n=1 Tax=Amycolatopsis acidicola TaxID=2596893 RepID=A0A5N0V0F4_9PSEU|nr:P-loop NTPase fold protein [Amycolatopsis acidicola]KAA9159957.1 response regulator [Amycolatopsis acidicola]